MSTLTTGRMSLLAVDFPGLYARHLCRHSQFGINVAHLTALVGVWFGVYGFLYALTGAAWLPVALAAAYLLSVAPNLPPRVVIALALFLALFVTAVVELPLLPWWAYLLMVPVFYKLQAWSHKLFTVERDMTEVNKKYPKGFVLFVTLLFYEVPFLLEYLFYDRKSWAA
jgi:hypothetical protein